MIQRFSTKQSVFVGLFALVGFLALQVPVTQLAGSGAKFTLFDAFGPIAPAFLGTVPGLIAVFVMQLANFLVHGANVLDAGTIIRFFPMLFGAWYFGRKSRWNVVVPVVATIVFLSHPIGRSVWYYALYWTIPLVCYVLRDRWLLARAFGATFSAHAVGGAFWIWTFNTPAAVWNGLIPIVALERTLFAVGMVVAYVAITNAIAWIVQLLQIRTPLRLDSKYLSPSLRLPWQQLHS